MTDSDLERIEAFEHRFAKAQATDVVDLPFGYAILQDQFPLSRTHNRVAVTSDAPAVEIIAAADEILGGAGRGHRFVSIGGHPGRDLDPDVTAKFSAAGYQHVPIATMRHMTAARDGAEESPATRPVEAVSLERMRPALLRDWRLDLPEANDETIRQLADRSTLYERAATPVHLAVYDGEEIAARANLFVDHADSIAQFEELNTHPDFRNRGYAGALLRDAVRRGAEAGVDVFFLTADLDDWPRGWYQRFGFVDVSLTHHFDKSL